MTANLKNLVGERRAEALRKSFPCVSSYIENNYDEENYTFDFDSNDSTPTVSVDGDHYCHIRRHIFKCLEEAKAFGREKIEEAFASQRRDSGASYTGTFEPTWFDSEEDASALLEEFLLSSAHTKELAHLEAWAGDKDVNKDRRSRRFSVVVEFKSVTGHGMAGGTDYSRLFECHAVNFVAEYTMFAGKGNFAFYDAYPCYTRDDRAVIDAAKTAWRAVKAARKGK